MRTWKTYVWCAAGLVSLAGLVIAQEEQGPNNDSGQTVARPRNTNSNSTTAPAGTADDSDLPKIPSKLTKKGAEASGDVAQFKSNVDLVSVDVAVLNNKGQPIEGIQPKQFRLLEDNVPQQIQNVSRGEAPMTVALVIEFSARFQQFWGPTWYQTLTAAYGFAQSLKPDDYLAIVAYDLRPEILCDFTTDRGKIQEALQRLNIPGFSEANLYDALTDTANRMADLEGRKAIVLVSSGIDTFSKLNYGETRKILQQDGVPVYAIGLMQALRDMMEARGALRGPAELDFLQADNGMRTFASETGGMSFFPRFMGEFPTIFQNIQHAMRTNYVITYESSNKAHDGSYRKIKVELVDPGTNQPVLFKDEKGKPIKYQIVAKAGYKAPRAVE
jgi:Ca-activated chloride channel homolog